MCTITVNDNNINCRFAILFSSLHNMLKLLQMEKMTFLAVKLVVIIPQSWLFMLNSHVLLDKSINDIETSLPSITNHSYWFHDSSAHMINIISIHVCVSITFY